VAGEVGGRTAVERHPQEMCVAERQTRVPDDQQALAVGAERDRGGDAALRADGPRLRLRVVDVEQVHGGLEGEVGVGAEPARERDRAAVRRPGRLADVVAVGQLPAILGGEVDHVELVADRAEHAGAVGLVVDGLRHQRTLVIFLSGVRVDRGAERDPARRSGSRPERPRPSGRSVTFSGSPPSAASTCTWPVAQERQPGAVRRPGRGGVALACGEAPRRSA
jgi:hypothetical protein